MMSKGRKKYLTQMKLSTKNILYRTRIVNQLFPNTIINTAVYVMDKISVYNLCSNNN